MKTVTFDNFYTTVTTAGTKAPLLVVGAGNRKVVGPASILITARKNKTTANTGNVYIGNHAAQSEVLEPGDRMTIDVAAGEGLDLSDLFVDATTNGDGVAVTVKQS